MASTPTKRKPATKSRSKSKILGNHTADSKMEQKLGLIRTSALAMQSLMIKEEKKEPVPRFRGTAAPSALSDPFPGFVAIDTAESKLLRNTLSTFFNDGHYMFKLKTSLSMASSGTGIVNSAINNNALAATAEFSSLSAIFSEFFITRMDVAWEPNSMYNYPLTGTAATTVSSLPIGCADLQHSQPAYTSQGAMANNHRYAFHNTGRPFHYSWVNSESPSSTVLASPTAPVQGWAETSNGSAYTGNVQFLSQSAPPALPATQVLGTFAVSWTVLFRVRL